MVGQATGPATQSGKLAEVKVSQKVVSARPRQQLWWHWANGPFGEPAYVLVSVPAQKKPGQRFPVLVALHGRGESKKGPSRGARGWIDDYQLSSALLRVVAPPLKRSDFKGFVRTARLQQINAELGRLPYRGIIIVCPYLPNVMKGEAAFGQTAELSQFLVNTVLPKVRAETPALSSSEATGIDGVSLGARAALLVGLSRPEVFGAVSGLQLAIDDSEVSRFTQFAIAARRANPHLVLRIVTSDRDYYRQVDHKLSRALHKAGVEHVFRELIGTHGYRFNRGPGAYELLLFHDRVLRGESGY